MDEYTTYLKKFCEIGEYLTNSQWKSASEKVREKTAKSLTMDELRKWNPELYTQIVEDVLVSAFAGRSDEVLSIVLPTIDEMRREIKDSMELLNRELAVIVDRNANRKFAKLLADIEKATRTKAKREKVLADKTEDDDVDKSKEIRKYVASKMRGRSNNEKPEADSKTKRSVEIEIGDTVVYRGELLSVLNVTKKYGKRKLVVRGEIGDAFIIDY